MQPVAVGDMVRFVARVVHAGADGIFRVLVTMEVLAPEDPGRLPQRSNRLSFAFVTAPEHRRVVLPTTYREVLMQVTAARRHAVEGLGPDACDAVNAFFREMAPAPTSNTDLAQLDHVLVLSVWF